MQHDLFVELAQMGEDYVAIGDWHMTVEENPMATFIANGMVRYGDEPRIADHSCILYDTPVAEHERRYRWADVKKVNRKMREHELLGSRSGTAGSSSSLRQGMEKTSKMRGRCSAEWREQTTASSDRDNEDVEAQQTRDGARKNAGAEERPASAALVAEAEEGTLQGQAPSPCDC